MIFPCPSSFPGIVSMISVSKVDMMTIPYLSPLSLDFDVLQTLLWIFVSLSSLPYSTLLVFSWNFQEILYFGIWNLYSTFYAFVLGGNTSARACHLEYYQGANVILISDLSVPKTKVSKSVSAFSCLATKAHGMHFQHMLRKFLTCIYHFKVLPKIRFLEQRWYSSPSCLL